MSTAGCWTERSSGDPELAQRVMWSPYPDHYLTIWAASPSTISLDHLGGSKALTHLDSHRQVRQTNHRHQQFWSISRDYRLGDPPAKGTTKQDCKTSEVLASHRLSFGNQSIRQLTIPTSSIRYLTNLVELRIPQNKLTHLPHSLFLMTQLEILNLENNRLDEHSFSDQWWRGMVNLRVVFLAGNRFRCLPPSLGRLPKLFYADVSDNPRLTYLPAELLFAPAIGTLAANRCSAAIAQRFAVDTAEPQWLSLPDCLLGSLALGKRCTRVPSLSSLCIQQIYAAITPFAISESEPSTPSEDSQTLGQEDLDGNSAYQLFAACEEIRRNPADFAVSSVLLPALDSAPKRYMCTICDEPVFCSELAIVKMVERWDMPFAWQCCSAQCQHKAIAATVQQAVDAAKWDL
ncbi:hypothetical protein IWW47_001065 [Coemansia sp. RSA 2052]|nr:hypothetical protein IWW47_001065 [Coemansia sp. RSA 2052]